MSSVVYQEVVNNFTNAKQTILDRPIVSVIYGPNTPATAGVSPSRAGEMYIQIPEGAEDHKLHAWISVAKTSSVFEWIPLHGQEVVGDNIVYSDKANEFTDLDQQIAGNKILTFVNGGGANPGDYGVAPQYEGQIFLAFKTLESGPDVAMWIGYGNTWVPVIKEAVDPSQFAKLNEANIFTNTTQMIGPAEDGRLIGGTRIKRGTTAPIADAGWLAKIEGEQTIFFNTGTDPIQVSIWTAISTSGINPASQWKMTWNSVGGGDVDTTNLAKLDEENVFTVRQKIGDDVNNAYFTSGRKGALDPLDASSPDYMPFASGDIYVREYNDGGAVEHQIYTSVTGGDADSWLCIYDSKESTTALAGKIAELEAYDNVAEGKFAGFVTDIEEIDASMQGVVQNLNELAEDVRLEKDKLTGVETRMGVAESKIEALETHHLNNQELFTDHGGRISTAELDIDNIIIDVGEKGIILDELVAHKEEMIPVKESVETMEPRVTGLIGTTNNHTSRIDTLERSSTTFTRDIAAANGKIDENKTAVVAAQEDADEAYNLAVTAKSIAESNRNKITAIEARLDNLVLYTFTLGG